MNNINFTLSKKNMNDKEKETEQGLNITKASGETVKFSESKLRNSLKHSGATKEQIDNVVMKISEKLYPGISTKKIYKFAYALLRGSSRPLAAKYHLKGALMELGPSGFPFEKYVGEILRYQGYNVNVSDFVQGQCVLHEVDVVATIDHQQLMIECKYHNLPGTVCDVKIPLYVHSRFKDVEAQWQKSSENNAFCYQGWVVTNTRFSDDAMQYGICAGLKLIGWDYPAKGSLKDMIDTLGLYPITCLTSLTKHEKKVLLDKGIVLCLELRNNQFLLEQARISQVRIERIMQETRQLCTHLNGSSKPIGTFS